MTAAASPLHACNWKGCPKQVPRSMWGCVSHWGTLPKSIRDRILKTWNHGRGATTTNYQIACQDAQTWISNHTKDQGK